jgi:hypothetical protein
MLRRVESAELIFAGVGAAVIFLASTAAYSRNSAATLPRKQRHKLPLPD